MTLAKALAGGLPMGAMLAAESVSESFQRGDHASTFGGGALVCAAALATIEAMKRENLVQRSEELGAYMRSELSRNLGPREVRGLGLMVGLDLDADCKQVVQKARERGVLLNNTGDHTLRLVPPLVVTKEQIDKVVKVIGESLR
jgi:acetylornithine/N-succinyldiaminopimelate aminotransferase